jgi:hypothetical protein
MVRLDESRPLSLAQSGRRVASVETKNVSSCLASSERQQIPACLSRPIIDSAEGAFQTRSMVVFYSANCSSPFSFHFILFPDLPQRVSRANLKFHHITYPHNVHSKVRCGLALTSSLILRVQCGQRKTG